MDLQIDVCKDCSKKRYIVNKKYCLCNDCNRKRLGSETKVYIIKNKPIRNKKSTKSLIYTDLINELKQEREPCCEGCGSYSKPLSFAHILSRKHYPEHYLNPQNLALLCFGSSDSCHEKWDSGDQRKMTTLNCYSKFLAFIKDNAKLLYEKYSKK